MQSEIVIRHDWQLSEVLAIMNQPMMDLLYKAHTIHRQIFDPNAIQTSVVENIKTGACPEDCGYCSQSVHYKTTVEREPLFDLEEVMTRARAAKANGATRFCVATAWRGPRDKDIDKLSEMIKEINALGLETCTSLGLLKEGQAERLAAAGLQFYNHNFNTSPEYYAKICSTHTFDDRKDTVEKARKAGIKICCGGIIGMGESNQDRAELIRQIANLPAHPKSVPFNLLMPVKGTPMANRPALDPFEIVRCIATARIMLPKSFIRITAGRIYMSDQTQALLFFAGGNAIFISESLLTEANPSTDKDNLLLQNLGLKVMESIPVVD